MDLKQKVVAIIPAKMTSRRCPKKNMAMLKNRPLLYYSIKIAQLVIAVDEIYISSEDEDVLVVARQFGAKTIRRPTQLSESNITTQAVLQHAYDFITENDGFIPDFVLLLQPTHPFRNALDIQKAIVEFSRNRDCDSLLSVKRTDELRGEIKNGTFQNEFPLPRDKSKEPSFFINTGSFYLFRPRKSFLTDSFFGDRIYPYILDINSIDVDIDHPEDLELARCMMEVYADRYSHFGIAEMESGN